MPSATVAISHASEPRRTNGRTATNSTSSPYSAHSSSARATASGYGQPRVRAKAKVSTAPSIIELPWAKLTVPETA